MKIYKSNKNERKWYLKINWLRLIVLVLISFGLVFLTMNILAVFKEPMNAFKLALIVTILVTLETVLNR